MYKRIKIQELLLQYKTPILYSGGSVVKALATMVVSFVTARYISPNDFGIWTTLNLAVTYSIFLQAGLINGLNLELPYAYGKGDEVQARIMAGTVQTFTLVTSSVVLLIGFSCFLFIPVQDAKIKYGILAITLFVTLSYYQNYLMTTFRSKNSFYKLSLIQIADAFVNLATVLLVVYFSYYGLIIKAVLVISTYVLLLHFTRPIRIGLQWNKAAFAKLIKIGLPIFGLAYFEVICSTTDKLILVKYTGLTDVGLYSFGFNLLSLFTMLSMSISSYIYPRMTYNYGKTNDKTIIWEYVKKITLIIFFTHIPLAILGYYLIPIVITTFFPKYILSITISQILIFAGAFRASVIGVNALWSLKSWKHMIIYQFLLSLLEVSLPYLGFKLFPNKLEGVAYGVLIAHLINLVSGLSLTYHATRKN